MRSEQGMEGKIAIVTGSSSGLGRATAYLAAKMGATVVLLSRDNQRSRKTLAEIKERTNRSGILWIPTDLSSQDSVRRFVGEFRRRFVRLDVLFNCAGTMSLKRTVTADGLETMFETNYLSHFLLTNLLFRPLQAGAPSRVITISGKAHKSRLATGLKQGTIDFTDLQGERHFSFPKAAKQAVLARILFTYELARRWRTYNITPCTISPFLTKTNIVDHYQWFIRSIMEIHFFLQRAQTPEEGASHLIKLATIFTTDEIAGKYYEASRRGIFEAQSSDVSYDVAMAKRLWDVSEDLVGEPFRYS